MSWWGSHEVKFFLVCRPCLTARGWGKDVYKTTNSEVRMGVPKKMMVYNVFYFLMDDHVGLPLFQENSMYDTCFYYPGCALDIGVHCR